MLVAITHPDGRRYVIPAAQVVVAADDGQPVAVAYEHAGLTIHSDVSHKDFESVCHNLRIPPIKVDARV